MGTIRRIDISQILNKFKINTFIETGTLHGDGVDFALESGFNKVISIEINEKLADQAKKKYENEPRVTILQGNSTDVLKEILPNIEEPVVFWLDAHFPGCDAFLASYHDEPEREKRIPLEYELEYIAQRNRGDVIICDDLWIYEDWRTQTGTFNEHNKAHGNVITREELGVDGTLERFELLFSNTHEVKKIYQDQGYLIFAPKI